MDEFNTMAATSLLFEPKPTDVKEDTQSLGGTGPVGAREEEQREITERKW